MAFQFAKPTPGVFLKPADHMNDLALAFEPKSVRHNVPSTYNGVTRMRDEVIADITVFGTEESLDKGVPTQVLKDAKVAYGMLTSELEPNIGGAFLGIIRKVPTKAGSGYAFRPVDPGTEAKVVAYFENREAAIAAAVSDAPDFD